MKVTQSELVNKIRQSNGSIFTAVFKKRHSDEIRTINCRTGVHKHVKGTGKSVDPAHELITVYDLQCAGYRSIPIEGLKSIKIHGETFTTEN